MIGNMVITYTRRWVMLFLLCAVAAIPAQAQVIEEIIVTATKRETSLQDTAMSITAWASSSCNASAPRAFLTMVSRFPTWASAMKPMDASTRVLRRCAVLRAAALSAQPASTSMTSRSLNT